MNLLDLVAPSTAAASTSSPNTSEVKYSHDFVVLSFIYIVFWPKRKVPCSFFGKHNDKKFVLVLKCSILWWMLHNFHCMQSLMLQFLCGWFLTFGCAVSTKIGQQCRGSQHTLSMEDCVMVDEVYKVFRPKRSSLIKCPKSGVICCKVMQR